MISISSQILHSFAEEDRDYLSACHSPCMEESLLDFVSIYSTSMYNINIKYMTSSERLITKSFSGKKKDINSVAAASER